MKLITTISDFLKDDITQRGLYGVGLIIWVYIFIDDLEYYNLESSLGIKYVWLISIPTILLIGQILLNRKLFWIIIIGLVMAYSIWCLWKFLFFTVLVNHHRDYIPKRNWPWADLLAFSLLFILLFLINWTIWKMKPKK